MSNWENDTFFGVLKAKADKKAKAKVGSAANLFVFRILLEEMKIFAVVDWIAQAFTSGKLVITSKKTSDLLYTYWKQAEGRLDESERRNLYGRVFGTPAGIVDSEPSREFPDLWLRLVGTTGQLTSDPTTFDLIKKLLKALQQNLNKSVTAKVSGQIATLSAHIELTLTLLNEKEIIQKLGKDKDLWEVIRQVNEQQLGNAPNIEALRALAEAGFEILSFIETFSPKDESDSSFKSFIKTVEAYQLAKSQVSSTDEGDDENDEDADWDF